MFLDGYRLYLFGQKRIRVRPDDYNHEHHFLHAAWGGSKASFEVIIVQRSIMRLLKGRGIIGATSLNPRSALAA